MPPAKRALPSTAASPCSPPSPIRCLFDLLSSAVAESACRCVQVDTYCEQLNRLAAQSLERLYVVDSLQRACGLGLHT